VPAEISRMAINAFIKYVALRLDELRPRGLIDWEWINQVRCPVQRVISGPSRPAWPRILEGDVYA
jgi:hypothetical protein